MMKNRFLSLSSAFTAMIFSLAVLMVGFAPGAAKAAMLELELTQGIGSAIPIALVPFVGTDQQNIAAIINNDLKNSGQFKLYPAEQMKQKPSTIAEIDYPYWQNVGINDLVVGKFSADQIDFSVVDVFAGSQTNPDKGVLLSKAFPMEPLRARGLAHHISDLIYEKITGEKGIFSTRIAYVLIDRPSVENTSYALEVADYDGYQPKPLITSRQPLMSPAWSPDGQQIAYVSFINRRSAIYVVNLRTGAQTLISKAAGINGAPAWSPDGRKLAIVLFDNNNPKIFIKDLNGGELKQVTYGASIDTEPEWAPDGQSLLFTSNRGGGPQIYRLNLADNSVKRVTFRGNYNASASFTPDGKKMVFLKGEQGSYNIAIMDLDTGREQTLTDSGEASSPSIAPNGRMIIFDDVFNNKSILSMVSTDGKIKLRLPARNGNVQEPAWSPFLGK